MVRAEAILPPFVRVGSCPDVGVGRRLAPAFVTLGVASEVWASRVRLSPAWPPTVDHAPGSPGDAELYLLRITGREQLPLLPGLDERGPEGEPLPSLLRDAASIALAGGAPLVEVAIACRRGARPWTWRLTRRDADLQDGLFNELLPRFLLERPGHLVVMPDLAGPPRVADWEAGWRPGLAGESAHTRAERWLANLAVVRDGLVPHRQIALLDMPPWLRSDELAAALVPLFGSDVAVCTWAGEQDGKGARQAWRPGSAAVAAAMCRPMGDDLRTPGLLGRSLELGSGRAGLGPTVKQPYGQLDLPVVTLALERDGASATVLTERTLLKPVGSWSLTALWTARRVVATVEEVASRFVFWHANAAGATLLQVALQRALAPFVQIGVLASGDPADSASGPRVTAVAPMDRGAPRLEAVIVATLRPWIVDIRVDVEISQGQPQIRLS